MNDMDGMIESMMRVHMPSQEAAERIKREILRCEAEILVSPQDLFGMIFSSAFEAFSQNYRTQLAML